MRVRLIALSLLLAASDGAAPAMAAPAAQTSDGRACLRDLTAAFKTPQAFDGARICGRARMRVAYEWCGLYPSGVLEGGASYSARHFRPEPCRVRNWPHRALTAPDPAQEFDVFVTGRIDFRANADCFQQASGPMVTECWPPHPIAITQATITRIPAD